ncbi:MAG: FAD-binding oxidoreductase [Acidobacteria bacterium]|nr:FAD-binding oxidoreductase [Acidobacteriota bacterium]
MATYQLVARRSAAAPAPHIDRTSDTVASFLDDAAHVPGGHADGVAFPATLEDVSALVAAARQVLPVGAQSSLTGGATPRGGLVLSTRALTGLEVRPVRARAPERGAAGGSVPESGAVGARPAQEPTHQVRVGAGVPLATLQRHLAGLGLFYPPAPTYDGAFVGGTASTNAAGAATFKYGSTRRWVLGLTVVLADGSVLALERGAVTASPEGWFDLVSPSGTTRVPVPGYTMPDVAKLSAGYFARSGMDAVDLFVGSEGTLGVIVDVTVGAIPKPQVVVAVVTCADDAQAVAVTAGLRTAAHAAWQGHGALDVSAVEYVDPNALRLLPDDVFAKAGLARPRDGAVILVVQAEVAGGGADSAMATLEALQGVLDTAGVRDDPHVVLPGDTRGAERIFAMREAVPSTVNSLVAAARARGEAEVQKTGGDMVVPWDRVLDSLRLYRQVFERRGLPFAIWGHISDGNLHPNVVPATAAHVHAGREALAEIAREVMTMGGAPLAEHGVGQSPVKQALLLALYGEGGVAQMRAVKRALDPTGKLAPGVLFPAER